eukprot:4477459-Pyramimonas_sp.AAC.1
MRLKAIITDPTPYIETSAKPDSNRIRSDFRCFRKKLPWGRWMKLTGPNEDNALASLRPSYGDGPTGMTATKSSGEAGQGGEGDDKSDAPNTEI